MRQSGLCVKEGLLGDFGRMYPGYDGEESFAVVRFLFRQCLCDCAVL